MGRRRQLLWAAAVLSGLLAGWSAAAEGGFRRYLKLSGDVAGLREKNRVLADKNQQLRREIDALRDDPQAMERAAREELGFVKTGELVFSLEAR